MRSISVTELRSQIYNIIESVHKEKKPIIIKHRYKGEVIIMSMAEYNALISRNKTNELLK